MGEKGIRHDGAQAEPEPRGAIREVADNIGRLGIGQFVIVPKWERVSVGDLQQTKGGYMPASPGGGGPA